MLPEESFQEVRVYNASGKLKKIISRKDLAKRSDKKFQEMLKSGQASLRNYRNKNASKSKRVGKLKKQKN